MKKLYSIGQISKLNNIPIKTLRYYDEIGLLKPSYINEETGYRYYTYEKFWYLDAIKRMKSLGYPLKDIKEFIGETNIDNMITRLKIQKQQALGEITQLKTIIKNIDENILQLSYTKSNKGKKGVYNVDLKETFVVMAKGEQGDDIEALDVKLIDKLVKLKKAITTNKYGYILDKQAFIEGKIVLKGAYVEIGGIKDCEHITKIDEGRYLCLQQKILQNKDVDNKTMIDIAKNTKGEIYAYELFSSVENWMNATFEIRIKND